jgi:CheY-like chemotaxis protein
MLKMAFLKHGFPIAFVAYDGIAAVELFKKAEKKPDVILMDYDLPGQNGIDASRQILAISPDVKIVFLTGIRMDRSEALALGDVTILGKPASLRTIFDAVRD